LTKDSFDASISPSWGVVQQQIDLNNLGGRIIENFSLYARPNPYVIHSDITIMPGVTLHIHPDVVMEFAPNVGILVLGTLKAIGASGHEIIMRPMRRVDASMNSTFVKPVPVRKSANMAMSDETIRLCKDGRCSALHHEGKKYEIFILKRDSLL